MENFKGNRIEIETLEVVGFRSAFEALRLPKGRECRTESNFQMSVNGNCLGTITDVTLNEKRPASRIVPPEEQRLRGKGSPWHHRLCENHRTDVFLRRA